MKTRYAIMALLAGLGVFFATSCSLAGLEPYSGKHTELPIISMQFNQIASGMDGASASRAIVQGNGYLYIRTQGGPTGTKGPFYGPYPVKANTEFTTNDIPEGSFTSIFILYSADVLDGTREFSYSGKTYAFNALMALPDADFKTFAGPSSSESAPSATSDALGTFLSGKVSYGEKKSVTLEAGKTTSISLTLLPVTSSGSEIDVSKATGKLFSSSTQTREFYQLHGLSVPSTKVLKSLTCTLTGVAGTTNSLRKVDFYDRNGKILKVGDPGTDINAGKTIVLDQTLASAALDTKGYLDMFMYLDYTGSIQATFGYELTDATPVTPPPVTPPPVTTGGNFSFAISGASSQAGKQVEFVLYSIDETKFDPTTIGSTTGTGYWGYGSFIIAADGTGSGPLLGFDGTPTTMLTGDYVLMAFIDANSSLTGGSVLSSSADAGDYVYILGLDSVLHFDFATPKSVTANFTEFINWSAGWNSFSTVSLTITSPGTFAGKNAYIRFTNAATKEVQYFTGLVDSATTTISCPLSNGTWMLDAFIDMDSSGMSFMPNPGDWCIASREVTVSADMPVNLTGADFKNQIPPATASVTVGIIFPNGDPNTRWSRDVAGITAVMPTSSMYECRYSNESVATELSVTQELISKGIKVLIIAPVESANCPAAAVAKAAGVKVISYDRLITGSGNIDYYCSFDNYTIGVLQGAFLANQALAMGGSGHPLLLYTGNYTDANSRVFFEGAMSVLQSYIYANIFNCVNCPTFSSLPDGPITITDSIWGTICHDPTTPIDTEWNSAQAANLANRDYSNNSAALLGPVFVLAPNDITARAISDVFLAHTSKTNLYITGQDAEKASVQYIIDGKQSMTVLKDVRMLGTDVAILALDMINGNSISPTGTVNNGFMEVPALLVPGLPVGRADIQSLIIDSGYYTASDFTGL